MIIIEILRLQANLAFPRLAVVTNVGVADRECPQSSGDRVVQKG